MQPSPKMNDLPFRLLAAVVRQMPADRQEWGEAMLAELTEVQGAAGRWSFAAGCLRVALFPPGKDESASVTLIKSLWPVAGVLALIGVALLLPELGGAGLAWAFIIYGIAFLAIPTVLFGHLLVLGVVAWALTGQARSWTPWRQATGLRSFGRFVVEVVFGLLNPLLYLAILSTALALRPAGAEWWIKPLTTSAWILLFAFWIARACGAAFDSRSRRVRVGLRALLLASLACLLAFALKDAWLLVEATRGKASFQTQFLHFLRVGPLYFIPGLLLWDYLRSTSRAAPSGNEAGNSTNPVRGFFLLPNRAARLVVIFVVGLALGTFALAACRRSEGNVRQLVSDHREMIQTAAARYEVDPRLIASIVFVTHRDQLSPFRAAVERLVVHAWGMDLQRRGPGNERWEEIGTDENPMLNLALDISVGLAQIKPRTAQTASVLATGRTPDSLAPPHYYEYRNVEPIGPGWPPALVARLVMPSPIPVPAERRAVARLLLDAESNLETCALILALYQRQWEAADREWSLRARPDILATLYQIGFTRSKPHGAPRSNAFGDRVRQVYEQPWLGELFRTPP